MLRTIRLFAGSVGMMLTAGGAMAGSLSYAVWDQNQLEATKIIAAEFQKQNPGVTVNIEMTPFAQYWVKLEAAGTGGVLPDVFWMNFVHLQLYAKNGLLEPLDPWLAKSDLKLADFVPSSVGPYAYKGKQYGIPRDIDSIGVWYNKDLFDKAGVKYPGKDWTWDDMLTAARAIKTGLSGEVYPVFMGMFGNEQEAWFNVVFGNGGSILSPDGKKCALAEPAAVEALRAIQAALKEGLLPPIQVSSAMKGDELFQSGKLAMYWGGSWWAKPLSENALLRGKIGVVEMPAMKTKTTVAHSIGHAVSAKSKNKEEAWKLVEFMSGEWAQSVLAESRTVIPARTSVQDKWAQAYLPELDVSAYVDALRHNPRPLPASLHTDRWYTIMRQAVEQRIWKGEDPAAVLPAAVKRIDAVLASER